MYASDFQELQARQRWAKRSGEEAQGYKEESIRDESVKFERNGAKKAELSDSQV